MSELKPCEPAHDGEYQGRFDAICQHYGIRQSDRYFLQSAIDALEEQDNQPANEPLTLEELRGMDGEPVWIEGGRFWALVSVSGRIVYLTENSGEMVYAEKWMKHMGNIYRRKPEGSAG